MKERKRVRKNCLRKHVNRRAGVSKIVLESGVRCKKKNKCSAKLIFILRNNVMIIARRMPKNAYDKLHTLTRGWSSPRSCRLYISITVTLFVTARKSIRFCISCSLSRKFCTAISNGNVGPNQHILGCTGNLILEKKLKLRRGSEGRYWKKKL